MHAAIQAAGRPMVQTDEGSPDNHNCSTYGGCGNAKRVGHDIQPLYTSMQSLVDIASGLWVWAHNASLNPESGGWWADLDMAEIGNGDFKCEDPAALPLCHTHFTMWCLTKAVLLIGSNVTAMTPATLAVYTNSDAISLNQDPLGIAGRRVAVYPPSNTSLSPPWDALAVLAPCSPASPTQRWAWVNKTVPGPPTSLGLAPCAAEDTLQGWDFAPDGTLRSTHSGLCLDAPLSGCTTDAATVAACDASRPSQQWRLLPGGQVVNGGSQQPGSCLDIPYGTGPICSYCSCHPPGTATNQEWVWANSSSRTALQSLAEPGACLTLTSGVAGGWLATEDGSGGQWCLGQGGYDEGSWHGIQGCGKGAMLVQPVPHGAAPPPGSTGPRPYQLLSQQSSSVGFNNNAGASGPWPHTRYLAGGSTVFLLDLAAPSTSVQAQDTATILDDNSVGQVTVGGEFCLDLVTSGTLEVWAVPLTGGRIGVALWNRSPAPDAMLAKWSDVGAEAGRSYAVRDVWAAQEVGVHVDSYAPAQPVAAKGVVLLILTPQ